MKPNAETDPTAPAAPAVGPPAPAVGPAAPVLPTASQALLLYVVVVILFVLGGTILVRKPLIMQASVIGVFGILIPTVMYALLSGVSFRETFRLGGMAPGKIGLTAVVTAAAFPLLTEALYLLSLLVDPHGTSQWDARKELKMLIAQDWAPAILVLAVLPAITEEALFRGYLLTGLERAAGRTGAVCACAFLFGLLHVSPVRVLATTLLGVLFGFVCLTTGSLGYAMLAHLLNNSLAVVCAKVPSLAAIPWLHGDAHVPLFPLVCCAAMFLSGIYLLKTPASLPHPSKGPAGETP